MGVKSGRSVPGLFFDASELLNELCTGIDDCTPRVIHDNLCSLFTCDDSTEFFFADKFWKAKRLARVSPNPFAPEELTMDIADLGQVHMVIKQYIEDF
ncbi:MAG: hypothetical protein WBQ58_08375 [Methanoregula sp.]